MSPTPLRRRRSTFNPFLAVLLGVAGVMGILLTLHFSNQVRIPLLDRVLGTEVRAEGPVVEMVSVLVTAHPLEAGQAVATEDVWDLTNGRFKVVQVPREKLNPDWILPWSKIQNRVMARAKLSGKAFKESDFFPKGTRPGVTALVPKGMRMVTVPAGRIPGLENLNYEDRFDLVAHSELDEDRIRDAQEAIGDMRGGDSQRIDKLRGAVRKRTVSHDAMRLPALPKRSGSSAKTPVAIAVAEGEVEALLEALQGEDKLSCVAFSGVDVQWAGRRDSVQYDPKAELDQILDQSREILIREGGSLRKTRVPRYREPADQDPIVRNK